MEIGVWKEELGIRNLEVAPVKYASLLSAQISRGNPSEMRSAKLNPPQLNRSTKAFNGVNLAQTLSISPGKL